VFGYMIEGEMLFELKAKPLGLFGLEKHSGNPAEKWRTTRMRRPKSRVSHPDG
jgi:hypothetical protein